MSEEESPRGDPHSSVPPALIPWQKKPRFSWTPAYETTFFQSLCESVHLGLRENQSFKPEAWNRALAALRQQGAYPTKPHLINKTDNARKKFRLWRGLVENPQFTYDQATRTVSASDDAWQAHLEKEPLARAFRDRPFDNAEYLEVLFPDVVGSAGQPKRITRPRRKGPDTIPGGEAPPGTSIMRLQNGAGAVRVNETVPPPVVNSTPVPVPSNTAVARPRTSTDSGVRIRPAPSAATPGSAPVQTNSIQPPPPRQGAGHHLSEPANRSVAGTALTPPEETNNTVAAQAQKRFAPNNQMVTSAAKRRRTEGSINTGAGAARNRNDSAVGGAGAGGPAAGASSAGGAPTAGASQAVVGTGDSILPGVRPAGGPGAGNAPSVTASRADGIVGLLSDVLTKYSTATAMASTTRWPEQALEVFFQEFADEDMDLQLRIAEKMLSDASKALVFCKMPAVVRKHWVKRLREASSRSLGN